MKVTHVVPAAFAEGGVIGGAERYAWELAKSMSRHTLTRLVSFGDAEARWRVGDLRVRVLPRTHYVRGNRFNPISSALAGEVLRADVVHCHQQNVLASSLSAMLARLSRRRVVVTDHGGGAMDLSWYMSTDRLFHRHLHVSAFSRSSAGQDDDPRASVVHAGIDFEAFAPALEPAPRSRRVLFVGRLLPHKGVHDLIDALPAELGLDVVGPVAEPEYARALQALATGRDVAFRGPVAADELVELYRRAPCVVLPSTYANRFGPATAVPELLGQTLLEAMACGTPAIATRVGGMPETILDGETGYVVPANDRPALTDRLRRLADNPALVEQLGRAAAAHVRRRFRWERVVELCFDAYGSPMRNGPA